MLKKLLVIDPIEPLSPSKTQITGPQYMEARILLFSASQPTTVLGALGKALDIRVKGGLDVNKLEDVDALAREVSERLSCSNPILMGPLLASENLTDIYIPLSSTLYVSTRLLSDVLKLRHGVQLQEGEIEVLKEIGEVKPKYEAQYVDLKPCYEKPKSCIKAFSYPALIGIALERRGAIGEKVVKLGYMYRYSIALYQDVFTETLVQVKVVYLLNCERDLDALVRVGGRGRVAKLYTEKLNALSKHLASIANPIEGLEPGAYLSVSYIPLVPKTPSVLSLKLEDFYGVEFLDRVEDVVGLLQWMQSAPPKVRAERLGLGFSESQVRRRPQLPALPPGTLIRVRTRKGPPATIEIIRTLWSIGYSTLYRAPIEL
ncbi:MAG: hypothetical protein QXE63_04205 [Zestosphaera sp.]